MQTNRRRPLFGVGEEILFILTVLIPTLAAFLIIRIIPIGETLVFSFFNWNLIDGVGAFVGIKNYLTLLRDEIFYNAFVNTISFTVFTTLFSVVLGLGFAYLINQKIRFKSVYETIIFIPVVLTFVPICLIWMWLFDWDNGFINLLLKGVGLPRVAWLSTPQMSLISVIIVSIWKVIGYNMVIFSVGLLNIPSMYYEAGMIDGASRWATFRHITLPLLRPITLFVMVISVINNLKVFTQVYVMTHGAQGGGAQVEVLVSDIFARGFIYFKMGVGAAESIVLLVVMLLFTLFQFRMAKES
jgi:multiple sugar transport system permease protein